MDGEYNPNLGDISVDNEVIKNIALKAAIDTQGIYKIRKGFIRKIWDLVAKKESADGIKLEFTDDSELKVSLKLMIGYGVNIPYVAGAVQESVKKSVEYMTGLIVSEVVIKIIEIQTKKDITLKEGLEEELIKP